MTEEEANEVLASRDWSKFSDAIEMVLEMFDAGYEAGQKQANKRAADICNRMKPVGGRAFDEKQFACFEALDEAAKNIMNLKIK